MKIKNLQTETKDSKNIIFKTEYPEKLKKEFENVTLDVASAILILKGLLARNLGTEDVLVLPMEGIAIKTLLEDYKNHYKKEKI